MMSIKIAGSWMVHSTDTMLMSHAFLMNLLMFVLFYLLIMQLGAIG